MLIQKNDSIADINVRKSIDKGRKSVFVQGGGKDAVVSGVNSSVDEAKSDLSLQRVRKSKM